MWKFYEFLCSQQLLEVITGEIMDSIYVGKKPSEVIEDVHEEVIEPIIEAEPFEMTIKEPVDTRLNHLNQPRGPGGRWVKKAK